MVHEVDELQFKVGVKEIYDGIQRIENKVDGLVKLNLDKRMTALENWRWFTVGAASVIGSLSGITAALMSAKS